MNPANISIPSRPKEVVPNTTAALMISVAFLFDLLQLVTKAFLILAFSGGTLAVGWIPFAGQAAVLAMLGASFAIDYIFSVSIALCAFMTFWLWFKMRGASLGVIDGMGIKWILKRIMVFAVVALCEGTPFANFLPGITIGVIATILILKEEYRTARKEWEGNLSRFEGFMWNLAKSINVQDARRITVMLKRAREGRISYATLSREARVIKQRSAHAPRLLNERYYSSQVIKPVSNEA